jgi:hypothetical protein
MTTTVVMVVLIQPLLSVTCTVYIPALAAVAANAAGSSIAAVNPSEPLHDQLAALVLVPDAVKVAVKLIFAPSQTGVLEAAETVGSGFTTTTVVALLVQPLLSVTTTVYIPAFAVVATNAVGSSSVELNPSGPLHDQLAALVLVPNAVKVAVKLIFDPAQTGLFEAAATVGVITTITVVALRVQPLLSVKTTV